MEIGVFAKTFPRSSIDATFDAIASQSFTCTQWNMSCAGLPSMPDAIDSALIDRIRFAANASEVRLVALSATFNMIHPVPALVRSDLDRLRVVAAAAAELDIPILTLCTGTRCRTDMWTAHPESRSPDAWSDLVAVMISALAIAGEFDLKLGIEPEPANVVAKAIDARRLIDELDSDRLGIIFDPANLIDGAFADQIDAILDEAFELLAPHTFLLHGKDRDASGRVVPAGQGIVPWPRLLPRFATNPHPAPIVLHGLAEEYAKGAADHLRRALGQAFTPLLHT